MLHESNPHTRNTPHGSTTQQDVNSVVYTTEMNQVLFVSAGGALNGIRAIRKLGRPVTLGRSLEDTNFLNKPATASKECKSVSGENGDACGLNGLTEGEDTTMNDDPEGHEGACKVEPRRVEGEGGTSSQPKAEGREMNAKQVTDHSETHASKHRSQDHSKRQP